MDEDRSPAGVTGARQDGLDGFSAAFRELYALSYQVAFRVLGDRGDAEDVAQETLARTVLRWSALADRPHGWVVRVSANLAIDQYRRRRRAPAPPAWVAAADDDHSAERLDLARALRSLPRRQREVLVLRYLADWSERDVARELGCSTGAVKAYGSRGVQALRRDLQEAVSSPPVAVWPSEVGGVATP
ncbi:MAG: sigma-70 family RNA polymerase sigma factor [Acidimicrobiales bacterium]